jgi:hypothetical protein
MTPQEHLFMFTLYAKQSIKYNVLVEILKTRGVVDDDDLQAFFAHEIEQAKHYPEWTQQAWETYRLTAQGLGVLTGLPDQLPLQKKE